MRASLGEALSIASALAWAAGVIAYKQLGESLPPLRLNLLKNLLVLGLVVPTIWLLQTPWPQLSPAALALTLGSGVIGIAVADTLYFRALNLLGAARMGIVGNLYSPCVIVLSFLFLGEHLGPLQVLGFALVMIGIMVVSHRRAHKHVDVTHMGRGLIAGVAAVLLMATGIVMVKRLLETQPLLWMVALRLAGGVLGLMLIFAWRRQWPLATPAGASPVRWRKLILAAFLGQYLAMVLWMGGYKFAPASVAAILNETASAFIVLLAALMLNEPLNARKLVGVGFTLSGVACMLAA